MTGDIPIWQVRLSKVDDLDRKLIATLRKNGRAALSDLAVQFSVSRATIRARIERLLAREDILGFTVLTKEDVAQSPVRGLMMLKIEGTGTERVMHRPDHAPHGPDRAAPQPDLQCETHRGPSGSHGGVCRNPPVRQAEGRF